MESRLWCNTETWSPKSAADIAPLDKTQVLIAITVQIERRRKEGVVLRDAVVLARAPRPTAQIKLRCKRLLFLARLVVAGSSQLFAAL